jgi:hypothetical protein
MSSAQQRQTNIKPFFSTTKRQQPSRDTTRNVSVAPEPELDTMPDTSAASSSNDKILSSASAAAPAYTIQSGQIENSKRDNGGGHEMSECGTRGGAFNLGRFITQARSTVLEVKQYSKNRLVAETDCHILFLTVLTVASA